MMTLTNLENLMAEIFSNGSLLRIIFSSPYKKNKDSFSKVQLSPFIHDDKMEYQFSYFFENRVVHSNLNKDDAINETTTLITSIFKQALVTCKEHEYHLLSNKSGKVTIIKRNVENKKLSNVSHDKEKQYIIKDNTVVPFLVELGVMNIAGKVLNDKYDKFRQINRFVEFVDDIVEEFDPKKTISIIDFGCGKSYLTFAIHYYLTEVKKLKVNIVGLDLKENVIKDCNKIVAKYNMKGIRFQVGDIKDYKEEKVDMVVTLHACDTATDYALYNAIRWNAKVILSVPCCQHELNKQIKPTTLSAINEFGIVKERISALMTDVTRAKLLQINGYKTQLLEFIDMEHTPKNILIRAIKRNKNVNVKKAMNELEALKNEFNYELTLEKLLANKEL
ncbi:MAG: SAM-dependent methyltransferase [Bacilli bacterium]|nr:SAM-dependent methyltransferase [Bacilli bacterium]